MTTMVLRLIGVDAITEQIDARSLHPSGVVALTKKMEVLGYLPQFPVLVTSADGSTYRLLDGAHRVAAAKAAQLTEVHALIREPCTDLLEEIHLARISNEASGTNVQTTLVDDAELVWRLSEQKDTHGKAQYTQEQIATALGAEWSQRTVSYYGALQQISQDVWNVIRTTFDQYEEGSNGTSNLEDRTVVLKSPFTEGLLRPILSLTPPQQLELCRDLALGTIKKAQFTTKALAYQARNAATAWLVGEVGWMGNDCIQSAVRDIAQGNYDKDWQDNKGPGPKLTKLVVFLTEQWEQQHAIRLVEGDFYELISTVVDASIDAIITDPPYNISTERVYTLASQADWSKDFGDWDHQDNEAFCATMGLWAKEYFRILKPGTTGFMFVGEAMLNMAQGLFHAAGFEIKGTFYWCRTNPGPSVTKADFMPAMDMAIQFVKPGAPRTFHYPGDADGVGFNWREFPLCSGHERLKTSKGDTLHPTQKPEAVIQHLMGLITVQGDCVFDGFMGVGTTARVAQMTGRKFLGFEQDATYFAAAQRRLEA